MKLVEILNQRDIISLDNSYKIVINNLIFNQRIVIFKYETDELWRYSDLPVFAYIALPHKRTVLVLTTADLSTY